MNDKNSENSKYRLPENIPQQGTIGDATLYDVTNAVMVLIKQFNNGQIKKQELENQIEMKILDEESKRLKRNSTWFFVLSGMILLISAVLLFTGREQVGFDLIKLAVGFGGAIMGGIGWATYKRAKEEE